MFTINEIPMLTAMFKKSALRGIRFKNQGHEDNIFWLMLLEGKNLVNINQITATYDASVAGLSANKFKALIWHYRIMRSVIKFSAIRATIHCMLFLIKQFYRFI
jgi:hypothetical protein